MELSRIVGMSMSAMGQELTCAVQEPMSAITQ